MNVPSNAPVMIMAGGTGGHIFPGLAVADALRARGVPVVWLGSEGGMETHLVPARGIAIETLAIKGLRGKDWQTTLRAPWRIAKALYSAFGLMRQYRPAAVISFGGYTAGPGGVAAWLLGMPLWVHEQNRAPGLTNRILVHLARTVLTGFPGTFTNRAHTCVGNPVRMEIANLPAPEKRFAGRPDSTLNVLVLGGSQGARALNASLPAVFAGLHDAHLAIRHQCGEKLRHEAEQAYQAVGVVARIEPFIHDMAEAYGWADVVIGRAGALTVAEICAAGVASILIPLPTAVDDHQAKNADYLQQCGGGYWFRQDPKLPVQLAGVLAQLANAPEQRLAMAKAARAAAFPHAAEQVADLIQQELAA